MERNDATVGVVDAAAAGVGLIAGDRAVDQQQRRPIVEDAPAVAIDEQRNQGVIGRIISDLDPFKGQISAVVDAAAIGPGPVTTARDVAVGDDQIL